jgi:hypothetical protein
LYLIEMHSGSVSSMNYRTQSGNSAIVKDCDQYLYVTCVYIGNKTNFIGLMGQLLLSNLNGEGEGQHLRFLRLLLDVNRLDKQRNTSVITRHRQILTEMEEPCDKDGRSWLSRTSRADAAI